MSTRTLARRLARTVTADTEETVTVPELPADTRAGDGYDWMDTLPGSGWVALPSWASEGWDAGAWPYIIFTVARHRDEEGELFGYGTYVEGGTSSRWFRSQESCFEAITDEVFFHWKNGQSHGPENLPATAAELSSGDRLPYDWAS